MRRHPIDVYERKLRAVAMRATGATFPQIAKALGLKHYAQRDIDEPGWFDWPREKLKEYSERKRREYEARRVLRR